MYVNSTYVFDVKSKPFSLTISFSTLWTEALQNISLSLFTEALSRQTLTRPGKEREKEREGKRMMEKEIGYHAQSVIILSLSPFSLYFSPALSVHHAVHD